MMGLCEICGGENETKLCPTCGFEMCVNCAKRTCTYCGGSMSIMKKQKKQGCGDCASSVWLVTRLHCKDKEDRRYRHGMARVKAGDKCEWFKKRA